MACIDRRRRGEAQAWQLQGATTSIFSITSPLLYTGIFAWFTGPSAPVIFAGAPYLVAGVFLALSLIVLLTRVGKPQAKEAARMRAEENAGS